MVYNVDICTEFMQVMNLSEGRGVLIKIPVLNLLPGKYRIIVGMHDDITATFLTKWIMNF